MGWEDRPYYRDRGNSPGGKLFSLLTGSVPFFTAFGIRVRIHASLIILIVTVILLDWTKNASIYDRMVWMGALAIIIILHEFGHCFAARSVGGEADEVLLWPLGGLAMTRPPHRPWPNFVTVAGGPLVNVIICVICASAIALIGGGVVPFDPFNLEVPRGVANFYHHHQMSAFWTGYYLFYLFQMSYILFLFNLLPIFPLDGGQILQSALWPKMGYYKATYYACIIGMGGAVGFAVFGLVRLDLLLICIAAAGFLYCRSKLAVLKEIGPEADYAGDMMDYSASLRPEPQKRRRKASRWTIRRLRKEAAHDAAEQQMIDQILAKVSAHGMQTLTWSERRALKRATERQRKRDLELSRRE